MALAAMKLSVPSRTNWWTGGVPANPHAVAHMDVAGQAHVVGQRDAVAEVAVVPDVDARHQEIARAEAGQADAVETAARDGDVLPKHVLGAADEPGRGVGRRPAILGIATDDREGVESAPGAQRRSRTDDRVWAEDTVGLELRLRTDDRPRAEDDAGMESGRWMDVGRHGRSPSARRRRRARRRKRAVFGSAGCPL
jgi:hypothetical protein